MSWESMAHTVICKSNVRLKFFQQKNEHLTPNLRRLLCNALTQSFFDYACSAWHLSLSKKLKKKIQTFPETRRHFCLQLNKMSLICQKELETVNS